MVLSVANKPAVHCSKNILVHSDLLVVICDKVVRSDLTLKKNENDKMNRESSVKRLRLLIDQNNHATSLQNKITKLKIDQPCISVGAGIEQITSAFKFKICSYQFSGNEPFIIHTHFFNSVKNKVIPNIIISYIQSFLTLKVNFELFSQYMKPETEQSEIKSFNTRVITKCDNTEDIFENFNQQL